MLTRLSFYLTAIEAVICVTPVHAAIVTAYTFDGSSAAATTVAPNMTASLFEDGEGSLNFDTVVGNSPPSVFKSYTDLPDGVFSSTDWFGFSVTPNAGMTLDLTSFAFDAQRGQVTGAGGNPVSNAQVTLQLAYSLDGLVFVDAGSPITFTANSGAWASFAIDLSAILGLQGVTDETWFRLVAHDEGRVNDQLGLRVDNVALSGNATEVPEPSSLLLFSLGACVVACHRRSMPPIRPA
jgi:hypothetical protein